MKQNNIIQLKNYLPQTAYSAAEPFDFAACQRRAEARFRRHKIMCYVENAVTAAIGFCTVFCVILTITML